MHRTGPSDEESAQEILPLTPLFWRILVPRPSAAPGCSNSREARMRVDRRGFLKATALGAAALPVAAVEPDNRVVLDLEPTPENPRNSEGAFATLRSGRVVFFYSQFYGGARDNSPARIAAI